MFTVMPTIAKCIPYSKHQLWVVQRLKYEIKIIYGNQCITVSFAVVK